MRSWDRQADETEEWYDRFMLYLYMGPDRTVAAAHNFATRLINHSVPGQALQPKKYGGHSLSSWQRAARQRRWKERAAAFDSEVGQRLQARNDGDENSPSLSVAGEERYQMVAELLRQVYGALRLADLITLSKEEARRLLPTIRLFFRDLLRFHQLEVTQLLSGEGKEVAGLNADELIKFLTEGGGVQILLDAIQRVTEATTNEISWQPLRDLLAQLYPDESSARRIATQAHLDCGRIRFTARAMDDWHSILTEAAHTGLLESVIAVVWQEYGANPELAKAVRHYREARMLDSSPVGAEKEGQRKRIRKTQPQKTRTKRKR